MEVRGLTAAYGDAIVLSRVSLSLPPGSLTAILGPAGAGKSTLLRCLLGQHAPRAGELRVLGQTPSEARRKLGYVPQSDLTEWQFPLTLGDAVLMGGECGGLGESARGEYDGHADRKRSRRFVLRNRA